jgi:hypothetical protein
LNPARLPIPPLGLLELAVANIKQYFVVQNSLVNYCVTFVHGLPNTSASSIAQNFIVLKSY